MGQFTSTWKLLASPKIVVTLAFTSFLIVFNWGVYVWTIEQHRTVESSLGYYINPLMNVIAGYLFLGERFSKAQIVALGLAAVAVAIQTVSAGVFPWIGLHARRHLLSLWLHPQDRAGRPRAGFLHRDAAHCRSRHSPT